MDKMYSTVGQFYVDHDVEFKEGVTSLFESFRTMGLDPMSDLTKILNLDTYKEQYKEKLLGDVLQESFQDAWYAKLPEKLEQLFENTCLQLVNESSVGPLNPIVGLSLPILKKNFIEGHSKDIIMTEIPTSPIIKTAFERKFLRDKQGNKHYVPEIFWDGSYKQLLSSGKGKPISTEWYPAGPATLPVQDLSILTLSGGSLETKDTLALDFCIEAVQIETTILDPNDDSQTQTITETITVSGLNIQPDFASNGSINYRIKATASDGSEVVDIIVGQVDSYYGTVSVASTAGKIKKVKFGGHLSNENNMRSVSFDREREVKEWKIPDGFRINTGVTIEKIRDYNNLFNIDFTNELIADMSQTLTQMEDSEVLDFLDTSLNNWKSKTDLPYGYKEGFTDIAEFSCIPPSNVFVTVSTWVQNDLKFYLNRQIDRLKNKLKEKELMFVVYGNPAIISLIQDKVQWIISDDTQIGGVQVDYKFGVMTENKNRIHVISTMKVPASIGLRIVAYPLTKEIITFKHYKYSMNIENNYRDPDNPNVPNIMATSRYLTTEVLPIQGQFIVKDFGFGKQ